MASAATKARPSAPRVRKERVASGPWDQLVVDLRALSPVGFRIDWESVKKYGDDRRTTLRLVAIQGVKAVEAQLYPPPYGISEALLIELGSRRGEWVTSSELRSVYRLTSKQISDALEEARRTYPLIIIENRRDIGYRLSGPLPGHIERIAPK